MAVPICSEGRKEAPDRQVHRCQHEKIMKKIDDRFSRSQLTDLHLRLWFFQIITSGQKNTVLARDQVQLPNAKAFLIKLILVSLTFRHLLPCCSEIGFCFFQLLLQGVILCLFDVSQRTRVTANYAQAGDHHKRQSAHLRTFTKSPAMWS